MAEETKRKRKRVQPGDPGRAKRRREALPKAERRQQIVLTGERPSPLAPPPGCVFSTRCRHAIERCRTERPALRQLDGRQVSCHLAEQFL